MSVPVVLVLSSSDNDSVNIIKGIVKNGSAQIAEEPKCGVLWNIINKYYSANILLHPFVDGVKLNNFNEDDVEGIVIYIKNFNGESLVTANKRKQSCTKALEKSEVNILLCDKCDETFPREQAMVWCLENDFELIELLEEPDETDAMSPIKDHYGIERVVHTLHANVWSNHEMQDGGNIEDVVHRHQVEAAEDEAFSDDEDGLEHMDEFCKLFAQMSSASENAASLPSEGRKAYAEQVVKAFWKAIGGDESELEDNNT